MATVTTTTYDSATDSNAITITLASLATSSTLVAGRASTVVSNTSNMFIDAIVSGSIKLGTTPTASKEIRVYVFSPLKVASSTFTYPTATATALTGSDEAATFEAEQLSQLRLAASVATVGTTGRIYDFQPFSVASLYGGVMPLKWGIFVTHSTAVNLDSTAGNHFFHYTGIKYTAT